LDVEYDNPFILQAAEVDRQDVDQEMELLRLMGLKPNRRIVTARLSQVTEGIFQGDPGSLASPIVTRTLPPVQVVQQLIAWAIDQSDEISKIILDFIVEPDDDQLEGIINQLSDAGLLKSKKQKTAGKGILSETLTAYIAERPRTKEELYDYARVIHQAKRPEAAVRQYLRRAVSNGQLICTNDRYIVANNNQEG
jgi:hypothetical protein